MGSLPDPDDDAKAKDAYLAEVSEVLIAIAAGEFDARVRRTHAGDTADVVAFLVNSTAEEIAILVRSLEAEREELRLARHQLLLTEKLAVIGEISASVAHELNQPLTAIRLIADVLAARPDDKIGDHLRELDRVSDAARRMHRIVDGIRDFSRRGVNAFRPTPASKPPLDALELLEPSLVVRAIETVVELPDALPEIDADADRLQQVFVNLFANAQHALESLPVGRSRRIRLSASVEREWLVYRVEDDGPGISAEHIPHIFDPFYTTKRLGVGTGLGLSVSHGIVTEHGGRMRYEAGDVGARFLVELPTTRKAERPPRATPQ